MLQARPLYDNDSDRRFFVEPPVWGALLRAVSLEFNVALVGPRGSGRTTVLRQLELAIRDAGERSAVYVDATGLETSFQLVEAISTALTGPQGGISRIGEDVGLLKGALAGGPPGSTSLKVVSRLRALKGSAPVTVLVDCTQSAEAAYGLFGRLRDELWQLPHRWVVAVEESERSALLAPPADAFFDQVLALETSEPSFLRTVLKRRASELPLETADRIAEVMRSPRAVLQAARDAALEPTRSDPLDRLVWRQSEAAKLGRPHSMLMAEIESLGGASASDPALIERLGWTRSRASQVLGELADAGLLEAFDERAPTGGRPRRVYRPADGPSGRASP